ncbi:MAG: P63C domain-containing protein [Pseudomonadota bacterium]
MSHAKDESKAVGGRARKDALAPQERVEIAKKAAAARWNAEAPIPVATHEGDLKIGAALIPCAVLDDGRRLLTQSGFMVALGRARQAKGRQHYDGDVNMPAFLTAKNLKPFISNDLAVTSSQVEFKTARGTKAFGYAAELLPKVCEVFLKAESAGALLASQKHIAVQARVLLIGLASTGIVALVDEATGYQAIRPQDALQAYLEKIISKELAAWVKKFPDEFYENIYKLRGWTWPGMGKNRYSVVGTYTRDLVFERLAPGLLPELESKSPKNEKGNRSHKLHQWLSDEIGNPMLAQHMHSLVMFQRLAIANGYGWNRFVKMVDQVLPKKGSTLELPLDEPDQPGL